METVVMALLEVDHVPPVTASNNVSGVPIQILGPPVEVVVIDGTVKEVDFVAVAVLDTEQFPWLDVSV
jgi:hypothetical protein